MTNHIAHFEIFARDVERTRRFYEQAFGWQFEAGGPPDLYHIVTGPPAVHAITCGLIARRRTPAGEGGINAFRCTISVAAIHDTMKAIEAAGGTLRSALIEIPHVGRLIEFADTDDNIVCAMQYENGL